MENSKISIVLPIYNVARYLDRCMNSIVNQTYSNLEIIMIDDGSIDDSPILCDRWAEKDNRIKAVHKKNAGLGMARNTGIEVATGDFICFFDSDDYIALDAIEKAYYYLKKNSAELVLFGFCSVQQNGKIGKCTIPNTEKELYTDDEVREYILPNLLGPDPNTGKKTNLWMSAWACMYSLRLINCINWRFVSEREFISEDVYSLLFLYRQVKSVAIVPEALYFYCENQGSLTHVYRNDRYEMNKKCFDACSAACDDLQYNQDVKNRLAFQYLSNIIGALKSIVNAECNLKEQLNFTAEIVRDQHFQIVVHRLNIRKESIFRKILLYAMRAGNCMLVLLLTKIKCRI